MSIVSQKCQYALRAVFELAKCQGGYLLSRDRRNLSIGDVMRVIEGPVNIVDCSTSANGRECVFGRDCVFWPMWQDAEKALQSIYDNTTYADLVEQETRRLAGRQADYTI